MSTWQYARLCNLIPSLLTLISCSSISSKIYVGEPSGCYAIRWADAYLNIILIGKGAKITKHLCQVNHGDLSPFSISVIMQVIVREPNILHLMKIPVQ
jgi:hypothetical protein